MTGAQGDRKCLPALSCNDVRARDVDDHARNFRFPGQSYNFKTAYTFPVYSLASAFAFASNNITHA